MTQNGSEINVGDVLFVSYGSDPLAIKKVKVDRKTPSGRLIVNGITLNPDLSIRGASSFSQTSYLRPTPDLEHQLKVKMVRAKARVLADCEFLLLATEDELAQIHGLLMGILKRGMESEIDA